MISKLSREMTQKTALLDLPLRGTKGGVRIDPATLSENEKARLMRAAAGGNLEADARVPAGRP